MRMLNSAVLIAFRPEAHEVGATVQEIRSNVKVQEMSLSQADIYQAGGEGPRPEAKLLIPYDRDYHGERELEYDGKRWELVRSDPYKDYNGVILLIRPKKGNSRSVSV